MIPNNTNHDTLSIYFDFLEDNNFQTEELRESLENNYTAWEYQLNEWNVVGSSVNRFVGVYGSVGSAHFSGLVEDVGVNYDIGYKVGGHQQRCRGVGH